MAKTGLGLGEILLGAVIFIAIAVGFVGTVLGGFNEFSEEDACTDADATCVFGNPAGFCAINGSAEGSGIPCGTTPRQSLPLGILFTTVLGILFAAGLFIAAKREFMKGT